MKTLKTFLEKHKACSDSSEFAKDLTLEQFLATCERGDWILWLFAKTNPESLKELTLAKAHCANTVRHLMTGERSVKAVDVAIAFGEGGATKEELNVVAHAAADAAADAAYAAAYAAHAATDAAYAAAAYAAAYAAHAAADAAGAATAAAYAAGDAAGAAAYAAHAATDAAAYAAGAAAEKQNQKQTADICRKFLPIEIWDQSQF
jgi:hypothetical protein